MLFPSRAGFEAPAEGRIARPWPLDPSQGRSVSRTNCSAAPTIRMCGRFSQSYTWDELQRLYRLTQPARNIRPQYNICPTDPIEVIIPGDSGLLAVPMRWQLIPPWWKKSLKELPASFNARAETVTDKAMFRDAFREARCVIPASGYYEWASRPDGKQPYYITPTSGRIMSIAGLWSEWRDRVNHETLATCTMIITKPNSLVGAIHDRMPALLDEQGVEAWLTGHAGTELLKPAGENALRMWPVSRRVNKPGNGDDASLIEPVDVHTLAEVMLPLRLN
jgi:putative SOS response-associated peptidase YedK